MSAITQSTPPKGHKFRWLMLILLAIGVLLMGVNLYGLTQSLRKPGLGITDTGVLRFVPKTVWSYQKSMQEIDGLASIKSKSALAEAANEIVHRSFVHVDWEKVDPVQYRQLIPFWENPYLYLIGRFSDLPQFNRYHFANYRRSIQRGIGICGDASIALSSVLQRYSVKNKILSFDGHVIVEYQRPDGSWRLLDPDFGVNLGLSLKQLLTDPGVVRTRYEDAGYGKKDINDLVSIYKTHYAVFSSAYHFMAKRYIFERISYVMKWLLPSLLILLSLFYLWPRRKLRNGS